MIRSRVTKIFQSDFGASYWKLNLFKTDSLLSDGVGKVLWIMRESLIFATLTFQNLVFEILSFLI